MEFFDIEEKFEKFLLLDSFSDNYTFYKCKDDNDDFYFIKCWEKIQEKPVKELWLQELRHLIYLRNHPNSDKYLFLINDAHEYENKYVTSYACESNDMPYSFFVDKINSSWNNLEYLKNIENRINLWENIYNLAQGLDILHKNKMLHRNISVNSIVVGDNKGKPDFFKLTGFEWILELGTFRFSNESHNKESSYKTDWEDFLLLCKKLFNFDIFLNEEIFSWKEKFLFNLKLEIKNISIIDLLLEIISSLSTESINGEVKKYYLSIRKNKIDIYVQKIKDLNILDDKISKIDSGNFLEFIRDDINSKNKVNIIKAVHYKKRIPNYFIKGEKFFYLIDSSYDLMNQPTWEKAIINGVFPSLPYSAKINKKSKEFDIYIEVDNNSKEVFLNWNRIIDLFEDKEPLDSSVKKFINSMLIAQAIDVTEYYSNIFSIFADIVKENSEYLLKVTLKNNIEDIKLSEALQKKLPAERFMEDLNNPKITEWIISDKKPESKNAFYLNSFDLDKEEYFKLRLIYSHKNNNFEYFFRTKIDSEHPENLEQSKRYIKGEMYIYPKNLNGNFTSLTRKNKAICNLGENIPLIKSLISPRELTKIFSAKLDYIDGFNDLDESKKEIFNKAFETYPNYIVQGPPGVGKTFLVKNIVEQIFKNEPLSKVVLSAQSHSTVEVLFNEIKKCKLDKDLIWLNAFNKDDDTNFFNDTINEYISPIYNSVLWKKAYLKYNDIYSEMINFENNNRKYSLYSKILASANIIFTTTNSRTIEDLIDNKVQFDWSIMEESAKASGHELISPLLLSYKRLLIGDHKQLPPFSEKNIHSILQPRNLNLDVILSKISNGIFKNKLIHISGLNDFIETFFKIKEEISKGLNNSQIISEVEDDISDEDLLKDLIISVYNPTIEESLKYYSLFKYLYNTTSSLKEVKAIINFGSMINEQYRMHPDISKVVSDVFYNSKLLNNEEQKKYYEDGDNKPFLFNCKESWGLNKANRVVWVDILEPFEHEGKIICHEENYTNNMEVGLIENILKTLVVKSNKSKKPSIAILSPYAKQVEFLNKSLLKNGVNTYLLNEGFKLFSNSETTKTVDSFQGGEADLVLVSLVRHNDINNIYRALGFLLDERRMNVLLSRAKHQLIIVGSLGMFRCWLEDNLMDTELPEDISFIKHLVNIIENKDICTIIDATYIGN